MSQLILADPPSESAEDSLAKEPMEITKTAQCPENPLDDPNDISNPFPAGSYSAIGFAHPASTEEYYDFTAVPVEVSEGFINDSRFRSDSQYL